MEDNFTKYLSDPIKVGFTESFPEKVNSTIDEIEVVSEFGRHKIKFQVKYCKVSFDKYECHAVITGRVDVGKYLPLHGWASFCHHDEARIMENGVVEMCKKHGLTIFDKICSWPFAKAIVSK